jgi:TetR/AcrR family transcriptional regulator, regulator of cefoperazone and chloramphenicol sensitivity
MRRLTAVRPVAPARRSALRELAATRPHRSTPPDRVTRQRVFDAATELFAEHGFKRVTVRQIAATARANVAAVNYHFGDKAGLYNAIVDLAISTMQETGTLAREAGAGLDPRGQLHAFVRVFLTRIGGAGRLSWIHRLMMREMDNPTDLLDRVVREVIEPRNEYLGGIVEALTGAAADDPRVTRAVVSIQGQIMIFGRPVPAKMPPSWKTLLEDLDGTIEHITVFSLGGLRAVTADAESQR